jgi:glycosyltransferase involved in cell wall biosynthesis
MVRVGPDAAALAASPASETGRRLVVAYSGLDPGTVGALRTELEDVELCPCSPGGSFPAAAAEVDVLHLSRADLRRLGELRRAQPGAAVVIDLRSSYSRLGWRDARRAGTADAILVATRWRLEELERERACLGARTAVVPLPVDLDEYAPRQILARARDAEIKRFRRLHRLADPVVLYVGPYTAEGGLDLLLDAAGRLRAKRDLRLAAVPAGRVDRRYLDRCEERALALGHRCVIEWQPSVRDLPLWYALATVVCLPYREAIDPSPAQLAAAAARPLVGSAVEPLREMVAEEETGVLVSPDDAEALATAVEALLDDPKRAARLGDQGRAQAEASWSSTAVARELRAVWLCLAARTRRE